ncbi:MAG: DUF3302 domain-containing protein [Pseudomonadota bacterium]
MDGLSVFSLVVLGVLLTSAIIVFVVLARMPGEIARRRNHPQADAVAVGGWLGLLFGGVLWPLIMIWAFIKHPDQVPVADRNEPGDRLAEGDPS